MAHLFDKLNMGPSVDGLQIICFVKLWRGFVIKVKLHGLKQNSCRLRFLRLNLRIEF